MSVPATRVPLRALTRAWLHSRTPTSTRCSSSGADWETEVVAANCTRVAADRSVRPEWGRQELACSAPASFAASAVGGILAGSCVLRDLGGEPLAGLEEAARTAVAECARATSRRAPGGPDGSARGLERGARGRALPAHRPARGAVPLPPGEGRRRLVSSTCFPSSSSGRGCASTSCSGFATTRWLSWTSSRQRIPGLFMNSLRLDHLDRSAGRAAILGPLARFAGSRERPGRWRSSPSGRRGVGRGRGRTNRRRSQGRSGRRDGAGGADRDSLSPARTPRLWEVERERGSGVDDPGDVPVARRRRADRAGPPRARRTAFSPAERAAAASVFGHLVTPSGSKIAHGTSGPGDVRLARRGGDQAGPGPLARQRILRPSERTATRRSVRDLPRRPSGRRPRLEHAPRIGCGARRGAQTSPAVGLARRRRSGRPRAHGRACGVCVLATQRGAEARARCGPRAAAKVHKSNAALQREQCGPEREQCGPHDRNEQRAEGGSAGRCPERQGE